MLSIKLSEISALGLSRDAFNERVKRYANEFETWTNHMVEVRAGRADRYPPPSDHPLVVKAVGTTDMENGSVKADPNYEVIDDTPTEVDLLPVKKEEKARAILAIESAERLKIVPPPLLLRKIQRALNAAQAKRTPDEQSVLDTIKAKKKSDRSDSENSIAQHIEGKGTRTVADTKALDDDAAVRAALDRLDEWVADRLAEIHDLTVENVDAWSPAPFEG